VRAARQPELSLLPAIELSGEAMFAEHGIRFPPGPTVVEELISHSAEILVIGDPPVGFAGLICLDGRLHLEQISTNAAQGRRGIGSRLLQAILARGKPVTLITFRDIPWNGPWYARHGFTELPAQHWGPELSAHWQREIDAGLHRLGPRLVMQASPRPSL
jgi:hypothetical protein